MQPVKYPVSLKKPTASGRCKCSGKQFASRHVFDNTFQHIGMNVSNNLQTMVNAIIYIHYKNIFKSKRGKVHLLVTLRNRVNS